MSAEAQVERCAEQHTPSGTIGWPVPYEPGDRRAYAGTQVCARSECQDAAYRWVHERTGHEGVFRTFEDARAARSGKPVDSPARVSCMTCASSVDRARARDKGWLVDQYPTPGGGLIQVVICFPCRQKIGTEVAPEREPCRGSCKGDYTHPDGWRAVCTWLGHCDASWSCWDEDCVREWAAEHDEPGECGACGQSTWHDVTVKRISEWQAASSGRAA